MLSDEPSKCVGRHKVVLKSVDINQLQLPEAPTYAGMLRLNAVKNFQTWFSLPTKLPHDLSA